MNTEPDILDWISNMPKAELHLHIDGSLQPQRMLDLAQKNNIAIPFSSVEQIEAAYEFDNLQSFLDLYYAGASVLIDEDDFYHLMMDYLLKCREQNVIHTEVMVEPQTYAPNGVSFATMMTGFNRAIAEAKSSWGQSALLILSFLRHLSEEQCLATLKEAEPYREHFVAIGLASSEVGNPPKKFERLYAQAREQGYKAVAHAGEEGPPEYVWDSIKDLQIQRIDHGVRSVEDKLLMDYLKTHQIPLTVCPLSNVRLCVFENMQSHNILQMLDSGLCVTVNSDDPAYFGGYMNENFHALYLDLGMTKAQAEALVRNSFAASFLSEQAKIYVHDKLNRYLKNS